MHLYTGRDIAKNADQTTTISYDKEGIPVHATRYNFSKYFAKTRKHIRDADYSIANLESPLVDKIKVDQVRNVACCTACSLPLKQIAPCKHKLLYCKNNF